MIYTKKEDGVKSEAMDGHEKYTLVNVCGVGRSGTTMVDLILGNGADAFSCGEVYAWFRPYRTHHFRIRCSCGKDPCPIWEKIKDGPEENFHLDAFSKLNLKYLIDSSKEICWVIDANKWCQSSGIRVHNLLLWKDPISLAYSFWKRGHGPSFWRERFVEYYEQFFSVGLSYLAMNFNEFIANPRKKLTDVCAALGMPYFAGKEEFWQGEYHHLFGSLGTRRQVESRKSFLRLERFQPEFEGQIGLVNEQMAQDSSVLDIIQELSDNEVSRAKDAKCNQESFGPPKKLPLWYYTKAVKRKIRKYFPQRWDHIQ